MCLWYDYGVTLQKLEETQSTTNFFNAIFEKVPDLKQDFEVKRFILGLSSLIVNVDMPQVVKDNYGNIIKALIFLSKKSIDIRQTEDNKKEEMAEVQEEAPGEIIDDEDDMGVDIDSDEDEDETDGVGRGSGRYNGRSGTVDSNFESPS